MIYENLCIGCMREKHNQNERCPFCGLDPTDYAGAVDELTPFTILNGKYLLGKVVGRGGFGITYLGYNMQLERRVAIKEFFPNGTVSRSTKSKMVTFFDRECRETFHKGLSSFLEEGKKLAVFSNEPCIVNVYDLFQENGTGYLVMEYLEGQTLLQILRKSGPMSWAKASGIILQVLQGLETVHRENMIHRDVSPDNIFIDKNVRIKLLDFGAARSVMLDHSRTVSVLLKPGYSPVEQYNRHGIQGPWTDVYGTGATLYRMLTGRTPEDSVERMVRDELQPPSALGVTMPAPAEGALMKSLAIREEDRFQSAAEFRQALTQPQIIEKPPVKDGSNSFDGKQAGLIVLIAVWVAVIVFVVFRSGITGKIKDAIGERYVASETTSEDQAETTTSGKENRPEIETGTVIVESEERRESETESTEPITTDPETETETTKQETETTETETTESETVDMDEELGSDLCSGRFLLNDTVFQFPLKGSALLERGFELTLEDSGDADADNLVPGGGGELWAYGSYGSMNASQQSQSYIYFRNSGSEACGITDCDVMAFMSEDLILPGNIQVGSKMETLLELYPKLENIESENEAFLSDGTVILYGEQGDEGKQYCFLNLTDMENDVYAVILLVNREVVSDICLMYGTMDDLASLLNE